MVTIKRQKVHVSLIHSVYCIRFRLYFVQLIAIMPLAIGDVDIGRYATSQIEQLKLIARHIIDNLSKNVSTFIHNFTDYFAKLQKNFQIKKSKNAYK